MEFQCYLQVIVMALMIQFSSCSGKAVSDVTDSFSHITDLNARQLLENACNGSGYEKWLTISRLEFTKHTMLFDSTGLVELERHQDIMIEKDSRRIQISWSENGVSHKIIKEGEEIYQYEGEKQLDNPRESSLWNTVLSTEYVMNIPFKLLEPGYTLHYEGIDSIPRIGTSHALMAKYSESVDTWWHYYEIETYRQVGYKVKHLDHISLVVNEDLTEKSGILWPKKRTSYRVNEDGQIMFLRAKYDYDNYQISRQ